MTASFPTRLAASAGQKIEVDFLYLDLTTCSRCRGSEASLNAAVEAVRPVLDSVDVSLEVRKTLVETEEQARWLRFVSSPTILVNGRDIAGEVLESACSECGELRGCDGGVDCRMWNYRGEQHTEVPTGLIVGAILAELARTDAARPEKAPLENVPENLKRFFAGTAEERQGASSCCSADEQTTCCGVWASSSCGCR